MNIYTVFLARKEKKNYSVFSYLVSNTIFLLHNHIGTYMSCIYKIHVTLIC